MDVLDKLQEKLVDETDEIHISNFDGERYSVKARNSHIYTGKTRGAIHRNIFRYTEKRLINAYEFLDCDKLYYIDYSDFKFAGIMVYCCFKSYF
jgi:hypothetical protein